MTVSVGDSIAVWFSCGAASAVAAKRTIELYGEIATVRVVNNPIAEEDEDNRRFLKDVEKWIGQPIEEAINPKYPSCSIVDVWNDRKYIGGIAGAPCTTELKKRARQIWEQSNPVEWLVLGFTFDEQRRAERFRKSERTELIAVLVDEQIRKDDCFRILFSAGIEPPRIYKQGYPNANCIGCCKATSPEYWNHVRKMHPDIFDQRAKQSREIGARLVRVKGERIFLDELSPDAKGQPMKTMDFECGNFCEERLF